MIIGGAAAAFRLLGLDPRRGHRMEARGPRRRGRDGPVVRPRLGAAPEERSAPARSAGLPRRPPLGLTCRPSATPGKGAPLCVMITRTPTSPGRQPGRALRLGIGGPVGSGKTALVAELCQVLRQEMALAVVTNDIYTTRTPISSAGPGCWPTTGSARSTPAAARTPPSATTSPPTWRRRDLERQHAPLDLLIIESGGDNLTATFARAWSTRRSSCSTSPAATRSRARAARGQPSTCSSSTRRIGAPGRRRPLGDGAGRGPGPVRPPGDLQLAARAPDAPEVSDWSGRGPGPVAASPSVRVSRLTARAAVAARADGTGGPGSRCCAPRAARPARHPARGLPGRDGRRPLGGDDWPWTSMSVPARPGDPLGGRDAAAAGAARRRVGAADHRPGRPGGRLDFAPQPAVAAAGCDHRTDARIDLAAGASLRWREEIVLGRTGSRPDSTRAGSTSSWPARPPTGANSPWAARRPTAAALCWTARARWGPWCSWTQRGPARQPRSTRAWPCCRWPAGRRGDGDRPGRRDHGPAGRPG